MDSGTDDEVSQRWCAGLPQIDELPLDPELRPALRRQLRWLGARASLAVGGIVGALSLGGLATSIALEARSLAAAWWLVAGLSVVALAPLLGLSLIAGIRLRQALRRDLARGVTQVYGGRIALVDGQDRSVRRLASLGYLRPHPGRDQHLELLPGSQLVLRVNGRPITPRHRVHVAELAPVRTHALTSPLPRELVQVERDGGLDLARRGLSPAEQRELQRYGAAFRRRYWVTVGLGAVAAFAVGISLARGLSLQGPWFFLPVLALLGLGGALGHFLWLRLAHRLEHDCELRWVISVRDPKDTRDDAPRLEVLPVSQLVWTEHARPAAWRLSWR